MAYNWIHATPSSGIPGTTDVQITCDNNPVSLTRTGYVTFTADGLQTILTVTQNAASGTDILAAPTSISFLYSASGSTDAVTVNVSSNVIYEVNNSNDWLTVSGTPASGFTSLSVYPNSQNLTSSERSGYVYITYNSVTYVTITVSQAASSVVPSISVSPTSLTFDSSASTIGLAQTVSVTSNVTYQIDSDGDWVTTVGTPAAGTTTLTIYPNRVNTLGTPRTSTLRLKYNGAQYATIQVTQSGAGTGGSKIYYTSYFNRVETPYSSGTEVFGADIVSNTYDSTTGGCITFDGTVTKIGMNAFRATGIMKITIPTSVTSIGKYSFYNTRVEELDIPEGVVTIETQAVRTPYITSLKIPSTAQPASGAFKENRNLVSVTSNTEYLSNNMFENCYALANLDLGNNLTRINDSAFLNCSGLTSITLPATTEALADWDLFATTKVARINCYATDAPAISLHTFRDIQANGELHVPASTDPAEYSLWMNSGQYYLGYYGWTISYDL